MIRPPPLTLFPPVPTNAYRAQELIATATPDSEGSMVTHNQKAWLLGACFRGRGRRAVPRAPAVLLGASLVSLAVLSLAVVKLASSSYFNHFMIPFVHQSVKALGCLRTGTAWGVGAELNLNCSICSHDVSVEGCTGIGTTKATYIGECAGRPAVFKTLIPRLIQNPDRDNVLEQEIGHAVQLQGIPQLPTYWGQCGRFAVFERLPGHNLDSAMAQPFLERLRIAAGLVQFAKVISAHAYLCDMDLSQFLWHNATGTISLVDLDSTLVFGSSTAPKCPNKPVYGSPKLPVYGSHKLGLLSQPCAGSKGSCCSCNPCMTQIQHIHLVHLHQRPNPQPWHECCPCAIEPRSVLRANLATLCASILSSLLEADFPVDGSFENLRVRLQNCSLGDIDDAQKLFINIDT